MTGHTKHHVQAPIAIIGMACRLPGNNKSPTALWEFLKRGGIASNSVPPSRFKLSGHHDKHRRPHTMKSPGGMFMEDVDPADFDGQFFNISRGDCIAMDPQQRQLLEVTYECLENAGIPLEVVSGKAIGCLVGTNIVDYAAIQHRDPENRPESATIGVASSILSNRISHFLNITGPSMTIDTACSASLVAIDVACRYLDSWQADGMMVAGANIWLSPEHNEETGMMRMTQSATGRCHSFDAKADGYVKAEGINCVYLKRLDDAIRDGDPIRAVIRGTATNSGGRTPGIASPNPAAQAAAIRAAYRNAGIADFAGTGYLECHGTGTLAGDPIEVEGAARVFALARESGQELLIGSIKSNIGHSEAAAGISGLIKAALAVETGIIPGNPTFLEPNPNIDFAASRVRVSRTAVRWPKHANLNGVRRASVNSFGFGGANAHAVLESTPREAAAKHISCYRQITSDFFGDAGFDEPRATPVPRLLVFSANDQEALAGYIKSLSAHLIDPTVSVNVADLAYTLSEKRSRHFYRAVTVTNSNKSDSLMLQDCHFLYDKVAASSPKLGFIFTGQGSQWPQMGADLISKVPTARIVVEHLDRVLQELPDKPQWTLMEKLQCRSSDEDLRQPELSQPLVTALQLALLQTLADWGIKAQCVVGHSSGEIAAAVAAGFITPEEAIKIAYYRGQAARIVPPSSGPLGMMAVGLGESDIERYLKVSSDQVSIACYNSPCSLTLSGPICALESLRVSIQADGHFARLLRVNLAYHSSFMNEIGQLYHRMLENVLSEKPDHMVSEVEMFSSVTGSTQKTELGQEYWTNNMISPVKFSQALSELLRSHQDIDMLVEIGPSNSLAGPVAQVLRSVPEIGTTTIKYTSTMKRGHDAVLPLYETAGQIFLRGGLIDFTRINRNETGSTIVDLPNYCWNHTTKYWYETQASKDWRFKPFIRHDLLGSKINGTGWNAPQFKQTLRLSNLPWLRDHRLGSQVVFPAACYLTMAMEAVYQATMMGAWKGQEPETYRYKLQDVKFLRPLVLDEQSDTTYMLTLVPSLHHPGSVRQWYEFRITSLRESSTTDHSTGLVCVETDYKKPAPKVLEPLRFASPAQSWYKAMADSGYNYGPSFRKHLMVQPTMGQRRSRSLVSLEAPPSAYGQSSYAIHPACLDACFHTGAPAVWKGQLPGTGVVLVPAILSSLVVEAQSGTSGEAVAFASAAFAGIGDTENPRNYTTNCSLYHASTGNMILEFKGLGTGGIQANENEVDQHTIMQVKWAVDISYLLMEPVVTMRKFFEGADRINVLQEFRDLLAHKRPRLKVLEINLDPEHISSHWMQQGSNGLRAACSHYHLAVANVNVLAKVQENFMLSGVNFESSLLQLDNHEAIGSAHGFDLAIVNTADLSCVGKCNGLAALRKAQESIKEDGFMVVVGQEFDSTKFKSMRQISDSVFVYHTSAKERNRSTRHSHVVNHVSLLEEDRYVNGTSSSRENILAAVSRHGWQIEDSNDGVASLAEDSPVLITEELFRPILSTPDDRQWGLVKQLVQRRCKVLWITTRSQYDDVNRPYGGAVSGLFRSIRAEEGLQFMTLDVDDPNSEGSAAAISSALNILCDHDANGSGLQGLEAELVERNGLIHVSRIIPDTALTGLQSDDTSAGEVNERDFREANSMFRLGIEKVGSVDSAHWSEVPTQPKTLAEGMVEVEVHAAGVNYKDVVVTMGLVPGDERMLGGEGAGVVTNISPEVSDLKIGDRVVVYGRGCMANRVHATATRVHRIPHWMTFEEAATLPIVYMTTIHSLFNLGNIHAASRVLIHSATGGVGIAAVQLARYAGAEIFATVGTNEKRQFLKETFGLTEDRIFDSRSTSFAEEIMTATGGRGVDVILNSLTGDMLEESFRTLADGGIMIELGKKDILARNSLPMEPFDRNISFRAVDMSYERTPEPLVVQLLSKLFKLIEGGHVKPINPIHPFGFDDLSSAIRFLRAGKHIGKAVLSCKSSASSKVLVRRAPPVIRLRADGCYLIVGGLRGLCGSLAIHLARVGATNLAVISRSGYSDDKSQRVIKHINELGAKIDLLTADVTDQGQVKLAFGQTTMPIVGIIQGAMVLRDRPFDAMNITEYREATACKIEGTWNLHRAAEDLNLDLDFFTMLSSISGLVGTRGQANYAAANTFMDSFAAYRRHLGLPSCSINLGIIEDAGFLADHDGFIDKHFDQRVFHGINDALLCKIIDLSILQQQSQGSPGTMPIATPMITGIRTPQPADSLLATDARMAALFTDKTDKSMHERTSDARGSVATRALMLLVKSKSAEPSDVLAAAIEAVNQGFMKILRLSETMDPDRPLGVYGIDSLAAVEIRNWIRQEFGALITTLDIMNAASLRAFCNKVVSKMT